MRRENDRIYFKPFRNLYCNAVSCSLGRYIDVYQIEETELSNKLTTEEIEILTELAVLKNYLSGVGELNIKVPQAGVGNKFLDKYGLLGREILSARQMVALSTSEIVGGRIGFDVENLLDYAEGYLAELSDFTGRLELPVFISLGRDIEEVGRLVNRYKMSPAEVIESFGFLDRECFLYGLNYIDKDDQKLLKTYDPTLIFMPKNDGEEGRGAINLFNFIYNGLKFCFSSGKCYNINMLDQAKLGLINTANLMHERNLISSSQLIASLEMQGNDGITLNFDDEDCLENIFDCKIEIKDENLLKELVSLEDKTKLIAKRIKEKI